MKVAIVIPPHQTTGHAWPQASAREVARADDLAEAMRGALAVDVPIIEGPVSSAPVDSYLLVFHNVPWAVDTELARRIIAINEDRSCIMEHVERYGFAGAVEKHRYFQWCTQRDRERGYGLIGRKNVMPPLSADRPARGPYTSANYDIIASDTARDLPGLIAEYLKAYDAAP